MKTYIEKSSIDRLYRIAFSLAIFTVIYNLLEGIISIYFGVSDETLTLFGFGVDSFIEVLSGSGIIAMVVRIQRFKDTPRSRFEKTALKITGTSFFILAAGLLLTALINILTGHKPETTIPGIIIAVISILVMWLLVVAKRKVGKALKSEPILADANCTVVCVYMSLVLLIASVVYELTGVGFIDSLGALGLIYFSVNEGREAFEKANFL